MQQSEESVWSEEIGGHRVVPVVKLAFDYIRRDRTQRRYTLEDEESLQVGSSFQVYEGKTLTELNNSMRRSDIKSKLVRGLLSSQRI